MQTRKIITYFLAWRVLLFIFLLLAIETFPLQLNFLGGGLENYLKNPLLWAWINFDGEHYLDIAYSGYKSLTYFYFPVFPYLTKLVSNFTNNDFAGTAWTGLLVSNIAFVTGLLGLTSLIKLDFKEKLVRPTLLLLLFFPTSFYFGSFYSESLFFALVIWSFYFARKKKWLLAGLFGAFSTATRVVGIALFPALIVEAILQWKEKKGNLKLAMISAFSVMLGIIYYSSILDAKTGDPLEFFHSVEIFGSQRAAGFILLPQVFYRYLFKILPNINYEYFPAVFTTFLELLTASTFLLLVIVSFFKLRLSYALYSAIVYLIPTFSGSFSSFPRYVLVIFPVFILSAIYFTKLSRGIQVLISLLLLTTLGIATALFVRGYWES